LTVACLGTEFSSAISPARIAYTHPHACTVHTHGAACVVRVSISCPLYGAQTLVSCLIQRRGSSLHGSLRRATKNAASHQRNHPRCICAREFALRQPSPPAARTSLDDSPARVQSVVECVCDHRKCCFDVNELSQFHVCVAHKHMSTYTHACDPTVVVSIYSAICCTHMYWCVVRVHLTSHCDHLQPHSEPRDGIARLL
jgi:hypothetical protein